MTRPLVLFTDETDLDLTPARVLLEREGCETMLAQLPSRAGLPRELPPGAGRAVALIVGFARIDEELLAALPRVRCIATMSAGIDMIDLSAAASRGIWVLNLADAATEEVASHALMLMLAHERHLRGNLAVTAAGGWTEDVATAPRRLSRLTLGLYGFGRIAQRLAQIATPTFARVIAYDPLVTAPVHGAQLVARDALLAESDILSLHLPLTPETAGTVDRRCFAAMRRGALLLNVSRGELVDTEALRLALDSGALRGAALDVVADEPPAADAAIRTDPRVLVTPHMAFLSEASREEYTLAPARKVVSWLRSGTARQAALAGSASQPMLGAAGG